MVPPPGILQDQNVEIGDGELVTSDKRQIEDDHGGALKRVKVS